MDKQQYITGYSISRDGQRISIHKEALERLAGDLHSLVKEVADKKSFEAEDLYREGHYRGALVIVTEILNLFKDEGNETNGNRTQDR